MAMKVSMSPQPYLVGEVHRADKHPVADTWGRGYSDAPMGIPYDSRLFMMQVFFAVSSSPISWTGTPSGGFSMIGFSLGGSIVMSFAATFPYLVNSVILLAPGGLLRTLPVGYESGFFRHRSFVLTKYLRRRVATILGISTNRSKPVVRSEPVTTDSLDLSALWQWQFDEHQGFVHAFIDTTQNGPLQGQHKDWKKVLDIMSRRSTGASSTNLPCRLYDTKMLVVFGDSDGIVIGDDVREELMGLVTERERIVFRTVPGGHGFPIPSGEIVANHIVGFWKLAIGT